MQRRSFSWVVVLAGVGLAGIIAVSAATALAARSAASTFEIVAIDRYEGECADCFFPTPGSGHVGTFTSGAPFCESGTIEDVASPPRNESNRRYTCSDGSGTLTLGERHVGGDENKTWGRWMIVEGTGRYADLRGKGSYSYEVLSESPSAAVYRTTLQGLADADVVAPSVAFTSASATKLRRPAGSYSIRVAFSLRDAVEGNYVAYALKVQEGLEHPRDRRRLFVGSEEGSTASGSVSTTLRVHPSSKRVRSVDLWLYGEDWIGNDVWLVRSLKLPRS